MKSDLEVVVIGALSDVGSFDFTDEVTRIKATMLYGDTIRVESPKVPWLLSLEIARTRLLPKWFETRPHEFDDEMAQTMADEIARRMDERGGGIPEPMQFLIERLRTDGASAIEVFMEMPDVVAQMARQAGPRTDMPPEFYQGMTPDAIRSQLNRKKPANERVFREAADDLARLMETGVAVLDTQPAYVNAVTAAETDEVRQELDNLLSRIEELLLDPTRATHPLFSKEARVHVRELAQTGRLSGADFRNANRVAIANHLVVSIPNFPAASVDELLDVRERVRPHLARFRKAVMDFEDQLDSDVAGADFDAVVSELVAREVDPALEELTQSLRDNGAIQALSRGIPITSGSLLMLGASVALGAPDIAGIIATATGLSTAAAREIQRRFKWDERRRKHQLFLLFDARRALDGH